MTATEPTFDDPDVAGTTATTPAPGDLVTYTQDTPWGSQILVGRVVASGIPDGGTSSRIRASCARSATSAFATVTRAPWAFSAATAACCSMLAAPERLTDDKLRVLYSLR